MGENTIGIHRSSDSLSSSDHAPKTWCHISVGKGGLSEPRQTQPSHTALRCRNNQIRIIHSCAWKFIRWSTATGQGGRGRELGLVPSRQPLRPHRKHFPVNLSERGCDSLPPSKHWQTRRILSAAWAA